uniref:NADH-ubiquinone oxidoreductase chain 4 n=1 Tax=Strongyloides cebus TaxID=174719 RepID=A0A977IVP7_9BILA|nr:NADH dehydrogenase subunit 4 [Strongyloides cebus]UWK23993.1 NADH dehydrogenase subunit 4 [Strongyloides cebus]
MFWILFSFLFFFDSYLFLFFCFVFCFFGFNCFSWLGTFFFFDNYFYVSLIFMSLYIYGLIIFSEGNRTLVYLTQFLILISIFFFLSSNFFLVYVFFEISLFPILVMIISFGYQIEKLNSFFYLVFYSCFCSFPFLFIYFMSNFDFSISYFDFVMSWEMTFILSLTFMMKFPVYFLHLWLPKAHVEAPTTASVLLAGLLLKFGSLGFFRILNSLSYCHLNYWFFFAFIGMIFSSFSCIFQSDVKSLVAYSSICHMSFILFSFLMISLSSSTMSFVMMIAHGYSSSLMFYFIGEFYKLVNSRMIYYFNSFMVSSMMASFFFSVSFICNASLPPTLAFFSEFGIVSMIYNLFSYMLYGLLIYFMFSFYYCIYLIINSLMGLNYIDFLSWGFYVSFFMLFSCFNVFWFTVFF